MHEGVLPLDPEFLRNQAFFSEHQDAIKRLATIVPSQSIGEGQAGSLSWRETDRLGKQQAVSIVDFSDGAQESSFVLRTSSGNFAGHYAAHPTIRKYYPQLHDNVETSSGSYAINVLVLDKLHGYDQQRGGEKFQAATDTSEGFDQLCSDTFQAVDELLELPLAIDDVNPADGHNVMYNLRSKRFELFDVDTLIESNEPHHKKFLRFIDPMQQAVSPKQVAYVGRMIEMYQKAHPDQELSHDGPQTSLETVEEVHTETDDANLIHQADPRYEALYRRVHWLGTQGQQNLPALRVVHTPGFYRSEVKPVVLQAIAANDPEALFAAMSNYPYGIMQETFVQAAA